MAYTPELSYQQSCTLRRIAWALGMPMTKTMEAVFEHVAKIVDRQKVCDSCRDPSRCDGCEFSKEQDCSIETGIERMILKMPQD